MPDYVCVKLELNVWSSYVMPFVLYCVCICKIYVLLGIWSMPSQQHPWLLTLAIGIYNKKLGKKGLVGIINRWDIGT